MLKFRVFSKKDKRAITPNGCYAQFFYITSKLTTLPKLLKIESLHFFLNSTSLFSKIWATIYITTVDNFFMQFSRYLVTLD